ncbi:MAG TPA: hypothetical protein VFO48_03105, partial [Vicinamibacterales bacterium]|nr:hypothetical protein [Vicinamibacterales bacterium]
MRARLLLVVLLVAMPSAASPQLLSSLLPQAETSAIALTKLDSLTEQQLTNVLGRSRVIVRATDGTAPSLLLPLLESVGGVVYNTLGVVNAQAVELPNTALLTVAASPLVARLSLDRSVDGAMERTSATTGAAAVREVFGYDGSGVGVA